MTLLTQHLTTVSDVMLQHLKQVRRRVISFTEVPDIGVADDVLNSLASSVKLANDLTKFYAKEGLGILPIGKYSSNGPEIRK